MPAFNEYIIYFGFRHVDSRTKVREFFVEHEIQLRHCKWEEHAHKTGNIGSKAEFIAG